MKQDLEANNESLFGNARIILRAFEKGFCEHVPRGNEHFIVPDLISNRRQLNVKPSVYQNADKAEAISRIVAYALQHTSDNQAIKGAIFPLAVAANHDMQFTFHTPSVATASITPDQAKKAIAFIDQLEKDVFTNHFLRASNQLDAEYSAKYSSDYMRRVEACHLLHLNENTYGKTCMPVVLTAIATFYRLPLEALPLERDEDFWGHANGEVLIDYRSAEALRAVGVFALENKTASGMLARH